MELAGRKKGRVEPTTVTTTGGVRRHVDPDLFTTFVVGDGREDELVLGDVAGPR